MNSLILWTRRACLCLATFGAVACASYSCARDVDSESSKDAAEIRRLCDSAQREYAPKFDGRFGVGKANLVEQLKEYRRYAVAANSRDVAALVKDIELDRILKAAESSPVLFRSLVTRAEPKVAAFARARKENVEREKSVAVSMSYYLAVAAHNDLNAVAADSEELEREKKEYFDAQCVRLADAADAYFNAANPESRQLTEMTQALGEILYAQPDSPSALRLAEYYRSLFTGANFRFEANERFLSALTMRDVYEQFAVRENIRGTATVGSGYLRGRTGVAFRRNDKRAEMFINLSAFVQTQTVGSNRGVRVNAINQGNVWASKQVYLNPNGALTTSRPNAQTNMKSTVNGIGIDRIALLGGAIIRNKVNQELPRSEQEGNERLKSRVAGELEREVDAQIGEMNQRFARMIDDPDTMIRDVQPRTSDSRLYLACCVGRRGQATAPGDRQVESSLCAVPTIGESDADVELALHKSAANNAAAIALAGVVFGPGYDGLDDVVSRFPGVAPQDVRTLIEPYIPTNKRNLDPEDEAREVYVQFDEVSPFNVEFEDGRIESTLRISSCDVDGKEWGPIEVRMIYRVEKRGAAFAFVREEVEVVPGGYQDGDPVSARFYTFRRIFVKRLETAILDEYVLTPTRLDAIASKESLGSLVVKNLEVDDGWIRMAFSFEPNCAAK